MSVHLRFSLFEWKVKLTVFTDLAACAERRFWPNYEAFRMHSLMPPSFQVYRHIKVTRLVAWLSGRTSISGRRTFPVLRSTCSWWVTTNVGKPSATGQPSRPTQPFILSGSIKWVQVAPSGERYEGKRRPGRKQRQTTAGYMVWFTSRHLRADRDQLRAQRSVTSMGKLYLFY